MAKKGGFKIRLPSGAGAQGRREENERAAARSFFRPEEGQGESTPRETPTPPPGGNFRAGAAAAAPARERRVKGKAAKRAAVQSVQGGVASWRLPRTDGKLRSNDRMILDYLRERVVEDRTLTTDEVGMREIAAACSVSHRTAQNTVRRLELAGHVERLAQAMGSNSGCRYRIMPTAPAKFGG